MTDDLNKRGIVYVTLSMPDGVVHAHRYLPIFYTGLDAFERCNAGMPLRSACRDPAFYDKLTVSITIDRDVTCMICLLLTSECARETRP